MEIKGTVKRVLEVQRGTSRKGNEWSKATVIVEYGDGEYPKEVAISNMKHADEFAQLAVGSEVTFQVDATSREFNGRWYTEVSCWKWEVAGAAATPTSDNTKVKTAVGEFPAAKDAGVTTTDGDELPFERLISR